MRPQGVLGQSQADGTLAPFRQGSCLQFNARQLPQAFPSAEFEALRPRLKPFEMVREAVLAESGRRVSQPACPAPAGDIRAGPAIRHMQCSLFGRGAPVALAPARARPMAWCHVADDAGVARATDRSSARRDIDRGYALRKAGYRTHRHHQSSGAAGDSVRMLSHRQGKTRAMAQGRAVTFDDAAHTIEPCDCDEICTLARHMSGLSSHPHRRMQPID